jgi:CxxC-x17-CxxC domain-containing protein
VLHNRHCAACDGGHRTLCYSNRTIEVYASVNAHARRAQGSNQRSGSMDHLWAPVYAGIGFGPILHWETMSMEFVDRVLQCVDCGREFVFTAGEQLFFQDKQFQHDPKRCKACKAQRTGTLRVRAETTTTCAECGQKTTVPFKPTQGRPVLCRSCFQKHLPFTPAASQPVPQTPTALGGRTS